MKPTHIKNELPHMVDVTHKDITSREAKVLTEVIHTSKYIKHLKPSLTKASLTATTITKVLPQFIPMTHPIPFTYIGNEAYGIEDNIFTVKTTVKANWYTGMEVEGYLGSLIYALTFATHQDKNFYHFIIKRSMLTYKGGGKSGTLQRYIGTVKHIYTSFNEEKSFIKILSKDPLFITNNPKLAEPDQSFPLIVTDANLLMAKGYLEIGPHVMTITYREIDENNNFLLMLAPKDEFAVIRKGHTVLTLLVEDE